MKWQSEERKRQKINNYSVTNKGKNIEKRKKKEVTCPPPE